MVNTSLCPCGTQKTYENCCKPIHQGSSQAATAEELMRSRYSAYAKKMKDYLIATWHPSQQESISELTFEAGLRWTGLKIIETKEGLEKDNYGEVRFIANYCQHNRHTSLDEHSYFTKENGRWYYVGVVNPNAST